MLSKNEIKDIQSLASKKSRDEMHAFVAEGPKIVTELIHAIPNQIKKVYALQSWIEKNAILLKGIECIAINENELSRISQLQTPNEVLCLARQFDSKKPNNFSIALYLDAIQDPGNFGTIIRIADWFGVKHVICAEGCADIYNPKVVQSTMGSIARVDIFYDKDLAWLKEQKISLFATTLDGNRLDKVEKIESGIILIGNESKGLSREILDLKPVKITIPGLGEAESLNAAIATGIVLSHLLKI